MAAAVLVVSLALCGADAPTGDPTYAVGWGFGYPFFVHVDASVWIRPELSLDAALGPFGMSAGPTLRLGGSVQPLVHAALMVYIEGYDLTRPRKPDLDQVWLLVGGLTGIGFHARYGETRILAGGFCTWDYGLECFAAASLTVAWVER